MQARADKFMSGHYAYFAELPERVPLEQKLRDVGIRQKKLYETRQPYKA